MASDNPYKTMGEFGHRLIRGGVRNVCIHCMQCIHMGTISARVPDELEEDLETYLESERLDRSTAVRKLLAEGLDTWRRDRALEKLDAGDITFSRAAEIADMTVWEFSELARERNITWVGEEGLESDLQDL